jgi:ankyrin repeat protein
MKSIRSALFLICFLLHCGATADEINDAAARGDFEVVKSLVKDNPDLVNSKELEDWTPLFNAARHGQLMQVSADKAK